MGIVIQKIFIVADLKPHSLKECLMEDSYQIIRIISLKASKDHFLPTVDLKRFKVFLRKPQIFHASSIL